MLILSQRLGVIGLQKCAQQTFRCLEQKGDHLSALFSWSVLQHATEDGSSAMKAGCCGGDRRAPISLSGSSLALDP